jgi:hypothetical protein
LLSTLGPPTGSLGPQILTDGDPLVFLETTGSFQWPFLNYWLVSFWFLVFKIMLPFCIASIGREEERLQKYQKLKKIVRRKLGLSGSTCIV